MRSEYTGEILQSACEFASKFMGAKAADDDHIPMIQPETGDSSGPGPAFRQFESIGDEIAYATKCIKAWHDRSDFLGDIAVVCMKPDQGKRIAHQLQALGIPHLLMATCSGKRARSCPARSSPVLRLVSSSLVSFIGLGQIETSETHATQNMKLLYVGMTRAKERLLITASGRNEFTVLPDSISLILRSPLQRL